jgi:hypothetical protein
MDVGTSVGPVLISLLPPGPGESLYDFAPVARAGEEAAFFREEGAILRGGQVTLSEAVVLIDADAADGGFEVVELLSSGPRVAVSIPCAAPLPILCAHIKDVARFCALEVDVLDADTNTPLHLVITNRVTAVRVKDNLAILPLSIFPGWNIIKIDLVDVVRRCFGRNYAMTVNVTITASCRIARIYFEARPLADADLPTFLRTLAG